MNKSLIVCAILLGLAMVVFFSQQNKAQSADGTGEREVTLFTYQGPYKMTPTPTLHSDLSRIRILSVELLQQAPQIKAFTKIVYAPYYGKIDTDSLEFRKKHETQSVSFLLLGDHTKKVKEGDILRACFYPN